MLLFDETMYDDLMPPMKLANCIQEPIFTIKQVKSEFAKHSVLLSDPDKMAETILAGLNATTDEQLADIYENAVILFEITRCPIARKMLAYLDKHDRTAEHVARTGRFAETVKERYSICPIANKGGIRCQAAHILDFAVSESQFEKYDPNNGILLDASIHICWDNQRVIAIPNPERMTVTFSAHPSLTATEIENEIPELKEPKEIPVLNSQQMGYFIRRYVLDMGRGAFF